MATMFKWTEMLLQNSKVVGGALIVLLSALGFTTFTAVEQHQELTELRIVEIPVEIPVKAKEHSHDHSHKQIAKLEAEVKQLKTKVTKLEGWH